MQSLPLLICLFLSLTFTSHLAFTAVVAISEAKLRLTTDLTDVPNLLEGEEVDEGTAKREAFSELNEDAGDEKMLMPARPHFIPSVHRCVYDFQTGKKRCYPYLQPIHFRHPTRVLE